MNAAASECVLIFAVCFNALLSIINGHVVALQRAHVILSEIAIYAAALTIVILNADRKMSPWVLLTLFIILNGLLLSLGNGAFNAKYTRDVLVIPTFVMLGMTYHSRSPTRLVVVLQTVIFAVALLEAVRPEVYSDALQVLNYYVNTRDFSANSFWNSRVRAYFSVRRGLATDFLALLICIACLRCSWSRFPLAIIASLLPSFWLPGGMNSVSE